jgi:hypothetical protein
VAIRDNVRVRYRDGLILGADELVDDQTYFRAALERRSLARDMFGIAWGLDLVRSGSGIRVSPGVAYGGDGKVIVVREPEDLSPLFDGKPASSDWAVYVELTETTESDKVNTDGSPPLLYCGSPADPRMIEGHRIYLDDVTGQQPARERREGARLEPEADLGGEVESSKNRVCLGMVTIGADDVRSVDATSRAGEAGTTTEQSAAGAQYAGVTAEGIMHPRRWTMMAGREVIPTIQLDPVRGVHLWEPTRAHADLYFDHAGGASFKVTNNGVQLGVSHLVGTTETELLSFSGPPAPEVHVTADLVAEAKLAVSGAASFFGLATMKSGLTVESGKTSVQDIDVALDATFARAVTVTAALTVKGPLTVGDPKSTDAKSIVPATFTGTVEITKTLTVKEDTTLRGPLAVAKTLNVTGATTLTALTASGSTTVNDVNATGTATFNKGVVTKGDGASGVCVELPVAAAVQKGHAAIIDQGGRVVTASATNPTRVIGIFDADTPSGIHARVVVAGVTLGAIDPSQIVGSVQPGDLLVASPSGWLMKPPEPPLVGTLVAKALEPYLTAGAMIRVLVTLG